MERFEIYYFDGKSSKPLQTTLVLNDNFVYIENIGNYYNFNEIYVGVKLINTPQKLSFKDGASCEIKNDKTFSLPGKKGDKFVRHLESKLRYGLISFVAVILIAVLALTFGSTFISNTLAEIIPQNLSNSLSKNSLEFLDNLYLKPSNISQKTQDHINREFKKLIKDSKYNYKIHYRSSPILGANAFALPSGDIVVLDDLIKLDKDKDYKGIISVLAHEAGHVEHKHGLKGVIKTSIVSVLIGYFVGDFSGVVTSMATFTINANYSREFEAEADDYAVNLLKENGISTKYLADIFENLLKEDGVEPDEAFSTHPSMKSRIEKFREGDL